MLRKKGGEEQDLVLKTKDCFHALQGLATPEDAIWAFQTSQQVAWKIAFLAKLASLTQDEYLKPQQRGILFCVENTKGFLY